MKSNSMPEEKSEVAFFDFLDLPGCRTRARDLFEHMLLVRASYELFPTVCPNCNASCLHPEVPRVLLFWDVPHLGHPTMVQLFVSDATCLNCGKFLKTVPTWLHPRREMTNRLIDFIAARVATQSTLTQVALDTGPDIQTIIDVFLDAFEKWDSERTKDLPINLGIDEAHFVPNRIYTILVDSGGTRGTIDVLQNRDNATIANRLNAAPNRKEVRFQTQDFAGPFREVSTKPFATVSSEISSTGEEAEPPGTTTIDTPLFGEITQADSINPVRDDYIRTHPDAVSPPLENTVIVGDHFHFAREVVKGFIKVWSHVRKELPKYLYQAEMAKLTDEQIEAMGKEAEAYARSKAEQDLKKAKEALWSFRYALRRGSEKRAKETEEEREFIEALLNDLPLLKAAWEAKNAAFDIFPHKMRASRSKEARKTAKAQEAAAVMSPADLKVVASKLDEWANMSEELKPYFEKALNLIKGWRPELLRIASTGLNNAKAEAKVAQLRTFNRMGRGLLFDTMRARQLWFDAFRRTNRWPSFCDNIKGNITLRRVVEIIDAILEALENGTALSGNESHKP